MKKIEIFEKAMNEGVRLKDYGINSTLFAAYRSCLETGNEYIDFNGVIWDYDIPEIIKALKENGISEFTISSTFSSLIETLAAFDKEGIKMAVLDYGDYTVAVWDHCFKGSIAEVYELIETPAETGFGRCECRISLIERKEGFEDAGHAMAWAVSKVK